MNDEIKRLKRIIVTMGMLLIIVLIAIVAWQSVQIGKLRDQVEFALTSAPKAKEIHGLDGKDGASIIGPMGPQGSQGVQGAQGLPGQNAVSTQSTTVVKEPVTTIIQQNIPVPGPQGDKGDQGEPAREIELGKIDGKMVFRYVGTTIWQEVKEVQ